MRAKNESSPGVIFISDLLPARHRAVAMGLALAFGPRLRPIPGARDIWCRDYMPVPASMGRFV